MSGGGDEDMFTSRPGMCLSVGMAMRARCGVSPNAIGGGAVEGWWEESRQWYGGDRATWSNTARREGGIAGVLNKCGRGSSSRK